MTPTTRNDNAEGNPAKSVKLKTLKSDSTTSHPSSFKGRVPDAHLRGEHVTHLDCWRRFGSSQLSHHTYILRGVDRHILMTEVQVVTSDTGRAPSIAVYSLYPDVIAEAGKRRQRFSDESTRIEAERRAA